MGCLGSVGGFPHIPALKVVCCPTRVVSVPGGTAKAWLPDPIIMLARTTVFRLFGEAVFLRMYKGGIVSSSAANMYCLGRESRAQSHVSASSPNSSKDYKSGQCHE